jgi:hypothetical protein
LLPPTDPLAADIALAHPSQANHPVMDSGAGAHPTADATLAVHSTMPPPSDAPADEAAARRVEGLVIAAAEATVGPFASGAPGAVAPVFDAPHDHLAAAQLAASAHAAVTQPADPSAGPPLTPSGSAGASTTPTWNLEPEAEAQAQPTDPWGGLPAPWQPLPAWLTSPNAFVTTVDTAGLNNGHGDATAGGGNDAGASGSGLGATGAGASSGGGGGASSGGGGTGGPGGTSGGGAGGGAAHFAEIDRAVDVPPAQHTAAPAGPAPVEPDLDALAHQVYTILKRRLASERRRLT